MKTFWIVTGWVTLAIDFVIMGYFLFALYNLIHSKKEAQP